MDKSNENSQNIKIDFADVEKRVKEEMAKNELRRSLVEGPPNAYRFDTERYLLKFRLRH